MFYGKSRGQGRKYKRLLKYIAEIEPYIDKEEIEEWGCEHFHVPCSQFISSPKTSRKIKTTFCKVWLDKTAEIIEQKPCNLSFCKVIAVIDELDFWNSQIIIFYDENYYNSFWLRDSNEQTWDPIVNSNMSFIRKRHLESNLKEKGYYETITDLDFTYKTILWFYGDIY